MGVRVTPQLDILSTVSICDSPGWQANPQITYNGENYVVVWQEILNDQIRVTRVTPDGSVLGGPQEVCEGVEPGVAAGADRALVVCAKEYHGVSGRFVDMNGQPVDTVIEIAPLLATSTRTRVASSGNKYLVVWSDFCLAGTDLDVFGRLVSSDGTLLTEKFTIADGPAIQAYPEVVFDGQQYLVVWTEGHDIVGRAITVDGVISGPHYDISHHDSLTQYHPYVCAGSDEYLVVWSRWDGDHDVYGNLDIPTGIAASDVPIRRVHGATIVVGPVDVDDAAGAVLYDLSGRRVLPARAGPGVYFMMADGRVLRKIIRVR